MKSKLLSYIKYIIIFITIFIPNYLLAQNAIVILRGLSRSTSATICRDILVPIELSTPAIELAMMHSANNYQINQLGCNISIQLQRQILENSLKSPETIYGPYKYMRAISSVARDTRLVNSKNLQKWKHINKTTSYNGVHHLISKSTIKKIYIDLKEKGRLVNLQDMENNAPSIFHPLHGHPAYQKVFHNLDEQYYDYKKFGMKVTIISLLERIDEVNISIGLKPYPKSYLEGVLKEAELWCKFYGIKWE